MPLDQHTIEVVDGGISVGAQDRHFVGFQYGIANGTAAVGVDVTTAVTGFVNLPANYFVDVEVSQDVIASVTSKTSTGFSVTLTPKTAAVAVASGTFNVKVSA